MRGSLRAGICIQLSLLLFFSGCKSGEETEAITLLEPVGTVSSYETAAYRNLYDVTVYDAAVYPLIREYAYETGQTFSGYSVLDGESVEAGDLLLRADLTGIEEQIEEKREALREMEENHGETELSLQEDILNASRQAEAWKEKPGAEGEYLLALHDLEVLKREEENAQRLYELDHAYQESLLEELLKEREKGFLRCDAEGVVVAAAELEIGGYIASDRPVVAVADLEQKVLKCDFIKSYEVNKAREIYALVDGKRYEAAYVPMDAGEYSELSAQGGYLASTFLITEGAEELKIGSYGVIVLVSDYRENAVTVSNGAVHKDQNGSYVYVYQDGKSVYTPVKTGMTDGRYMEIVSGLASGEKVVAQGQYDPGEKVVTLERGSSFALFGSMGEISYPVWEPVRNEVEYGTVYFQEFLVAEDQYVHRGDTLALVRVEPDEAALARLRDQLTRAQERLEDCKRQWQDRTAAGEEADAESYGEELARRTENIASLKEQIEKMEQDFAVTRVTAPADGIITWMGDYEREDLLGYKSSLLNIGDTDFYYITVERQAEAQLQYGNRLQVSSLEEEGESVWADVVNVGNGGLSPLLQSSRVLLVPEEPLAGMTESFQGVDGRYVPKTFKLTGVVKEMENVVLVPAEAVTEAEGQYYVNVLEADGSVVERSFVAGGRDGENYWVVDGLQEGMKICCE